MNTPPRKPPRPVPPRSSSARPGGSAKPLPPEGSGASPSGANPTSPPPGSPPPRRSVRQQPTAPGRPTRVMPQQPADRPPGQPIHPPAQPLPQSGMGAVNRTQLLPQDSQPAGPGHQPGPPPRQPAGGPARDVSSHRAPPVCCLGTRSAQQLKHAGGGLVGLGQHGVTRLAQDVGPGELHHLLGHVRITDAGLGR